MSDEPSPRSEIILYQTEDGRTRIECRFENENVWMTQALMAELFQTTVPNINLHLRNIYEEGELTAKATIKKYLIVRLEGGRQVRRPVFHYNLEAIYAEGELRKAATCKNYLQVQTEGKRQVQRALRHCSPSPPLGERWHFISTNSGSWKETFAETWNRDIKPTGNGQRVPLSWGRGLG